MFIFSLIEHRPHLFEAARYEWRGRARGSEAADLY